MRALDMAVYSRKLFGMFSGQERRVRMRFDNRLGRRGARPARAGRVAHPGRGDALFVSADVVVSPQFFAWVYGFGAMAQIVGPADVVEQMRGQLADVARLYGKD